MAVATQPAPNTPGTPPRNVQPQAGAAEEAVLGKAYDVALVKRLWPFIRPHWKLLLAWACFMPVTIALELAQPALFRYALTTHILRGDIGPLGSAELRPPRDGLPRALRRLRADPALSARRRRVRDGPQRRGSVRGVASAATKDRRLSAYRALGAVVEFTKMPRIRGGRYSGLSAGLGMSGCWGTCVLLMSSICCASLVCFNHLQRLPRPRRVRNLAAG